MFSLGVLGAFASGALREAHRADGLTREQELERLKTRVRRMGELELFAQDFFRGMRGAKLEETSFELQGGTEFAPMSTTSDLDVALQYSSGATTRLIFKLLTSGLMDRGASLQYLSAFPDEVEYLYPPLTYLEPVHGQKETIKVVIDGESVVYTIIEVVPHFSS